MTARRVAAAVTAGVVGIGATIATVIATLRRTRARRAAGLRATALALSGRSLRVWRMTARGTGRYAGMRVRRAITPAERRAELDAQFAVRTAEDVAKELGEMKGVLMKAGQMLSFIAEGLPDEAQTVLAQLQADAAPMAPSLAAGVVQAELGADPAVLFRTWEDLPVAAASIGQVHRAVDDADRALAVKVQFPGADAAIRQDLDAAEVLYAMFSTLALNGLDARALVDELRLRMVDELDYRKEAANLVAFTDAFAGHPWIRIPQLVGEFSSARVLTTEWVDGMTWEQLMASPVATKQQIGEVIWRFAQHSVQRLGMFNGDPHPGNYKFHHDASVTFLDFGLVKRWEPGEWQRLEPTLDAVVVDRDPEQLVDAMIAAEFLSAGHGLDPQRVYDYVSAPYRPYLVDEFTFTRSWMADTLGRIADLNGPHADVIAKLNMPPSFVILDRVVWGVSAILGRLEVTAPWRAMILEYRTGAPPATPLGEAELAWRS